MDNEQIQSLISQLKGVGLDDEQILDVFYETFKKGKMDRKDLETLADSLGYELDDDFKNDPTPDPIEGGKGEPAPAGDDNITKGEAEDLKEIKPGESKEEFKEKIDEAKDDIEADKDDKEEEEEKDDKADDADKDEEDEVMNKYFKI